MAKALSVKLKIDADGNVSGVVNGINNDLKKMGGQVDKVSDSTDRLTSSLKHVGHYGLAAFAGWGLSNLVGDVVNATKEMQSLQASLITVKGSAVEADKAFSQIQEFAKTTPYQLTEVTDAFIKMEALGLTASERAMRSYGDTASSMGKSLNQMVEAVADAATGEFERLKEFGIKASSEGDKVTFTFKGVATEVGKNAAEIEAYLMRLGEVNFAGGMKLQMETLGGQLSNLEDNWAQALNALGTASQPAISAAIGGLNDLADGIESAADFMDEAALLAGVGLTTALTAKAIPAIWATSTAFNAATASAGGFAAATRAATAAGLAFAATPLGLAVTAVAGTVAYLALREDEAEIATRDLTEALKENNVELSRGEFKKRAEQLKEYRQEYDALLTLKKQNAAIDILGWKEGDLQRKIDRLMMGLDATVKLTKATEPLIDLEKEFKASVDDSTESLSQFSEMLSFIAQTESSKEREAIQAKINALTLSEAQQRQLILNNLEPENRALQEKLFAIQDAQAAQAAADQAKQEAAEIAIDAVEREIAAVYELSNARQEAYRQNTIDAQWNKDNAAFDAMDAIDLDASAFADEIENMALSVDSIGDAWTRTGDAASQAIANMMATHQDFAKQYIAAGKDQEKIDEDRFKLNDMYQKGVIDFSEFKESQAKLDAKQDELKAQNLDNQINLYAGIASNIKNMASEGSAAAKVAMVAEQGLALVQGVRAVIRAWGDPYPLNLVSVPLTIASVGSLLGQIGQSFSGGSGGGSAPITANGMTAEQNIAFTEATYEPMIDRLDRQIELLESIDRQGSAYEFGIDAARLTFEKDYKVAVQEAFADGTLKVNLLNNGNELNAASFADYGQITQNLGFDFFKTDGSDDFFEKTKYAYLDTQSLSEGYNYLKLITSEYADLVSFVQDQGWKKAGMSPKEFGELQQEVLISDFQEVLSEFALSIVDTMTELQDAGDSFKEMYDSVTGTVFYETLRLEQAYADVERLANGRTFSDFLQDEIENIEALGQFFSDDVFAKLMSQDPADAIAQIAILEELEQKTGMTFENGAREALDYLESIELVAGAQSKAREENEDLRLKLLELQDPLAYEAQLRQEQLMSLDESNRALQQNIWALEEQAESAQRSAAVIAGLEDEWLALTDKAAFDALQKQRELDDLRESAGEDAVNLQKKIWEEQARQAEEQARLAEQERINANQQRIQAEVQAEAQREVAAAAEAYARELQAQEDAYIRLSDRLLELQDPALYEQTIRDRTLEGLNEVNQALQIQIWELEDAAELAAKASESASIRVQDAWEGIGDSIIDEINRIRGEVMAESSTETFSQAQAQFDTNLALALAGNSTAASMLPELSKTMLDLAESALSSRADITHLKYSTANALSGIPAFAEGGMHSGGLRLVGERGPVLEFTGPSRIVNNQDTMRMFDNTKMVAQLEQLNSRLDEVVDRLESNEFNTRKTRESLEDIQKGLPVYQLEGV
ncbi:tape measure protein [Thiomicrorhabdus indica]|uniref:tape measure protein n=1 Tax=Thiomicrorhabdus indica TaxID=2267253 RepID=UPI002AA66D70|nr:tape measure protein [Thiomicrorhabdus indica]